LGRQTAVREQLWLLRTLATELTAAELLKAKDCSDALRKALYGVLSTTIHQFHWIVNQEKRTYLRDGPLHVNFFKSLLVAANSFFLHILKNLFCNVRFHFFNLRDHNFFYSSNASTPLQKISIFIYCGCSSTYPYCNWKQSHTSYHCRQDDRRRVRW
jgi:hypothetical protein